MSTQAPAGAIAAAVVEFLRSHPPFDHVEDATLAALVAACRVAYFARGETIVSPATGVPDALYIVNKGRVLVEQSDENRAAGTPNLALGPGECFPLSALIGTRATTSIYRAAGDVFCYAIPAERVHELLRTSPALLLSWQPFPGQSTPVVELTDGSSAPLWVLSSTIRGHGFSMDGATPAEIRAGILARYLGAVSGRPPTYVPPPP